MVVQAVVPVCACDPLRAVEGRPPNGGKVTCIVLDGQQEGSWLPPAEICLPGCKSSAAEARRWVGGVLTDVGVCGGLVDDVQVCASELFGNSAEHTDSGLVTVTLAIGEAALWLWVDDDGADDSRPHLVRAGPDSQCGRGLAMVAELADHWCTYTVGGRQRTAAAWFDRTVLPEAA